MTQYIDKTDVLPWRDVVSIVATYTDGAQMGGSGVVIGINDVLTAAHVVDDTEHGAVVSVKVTPGQNGAGSAPCGTFTAADIQYNELSSKDGMLSLSEIAKDVAVLGFRQKIGEVVGGWMGLDPGFTGGTVNVTGFPGYAQGKMVNDTGAVYDLDDVTMSSQLNIQPGNSGGPLWCVENGDPAVVGIVSTKPWAFDVGTGYDTIMGWMSKNDELISIPPSNGTIACDTAAKGCLSGSTEGDVYGVNLLAGHTYVIDAEGAASGKGTLDNPFLALFDKDNHCLISNNDGGIGANAKIEFTPATSATCSLELISAGSERTGTYTLDVLDVTSKSVSAPWFDPQYYLQSKTAQVNGEGYRGRSDWSALEVQSLIAAAGMTLEDHYKRYGCFEQSVNPSASFNDETYYHNKALQLDSICYGGNSNWTDGAVAAVFQSLNIDPITHFLAWGASEGVSPIKS